MNALVSQTPIVQQALYLLQQASGDVGLKLTDTGALNRKFVQSFWDLYIGSPEHARLRPTRELECAEASRIYFLLSESGYVRKYRAKINLTEKGESALRGGRHEELYYDLLTVGIYGWNWGYEDRYPDYEFIQQSGEELIQKLLVTPAKEVVPEKIFGEVFGELTSKVSAQELEWLQRCLTVRFFYRFCIPFGILKGEGGDPMMNKRPDDKFEKTEFFIVAFSNLIKTVTEPVEKVYENFSI